MKKQIFTLLLSTAIFTTNPLWAMDLDTSITEQYSLTVAQVRPYLNPENLVAGETFDTFSFMKDGKSYRIKLCFSNEYWPLPGGPLANPGSFAMKDVKYEDRLTFSKYENVYSLFPVLKRYNLPSSFFVTQGIQIENAIMAISYAIYEDLSKAPQSADNKTEETAAINNRARFLCTQHKTERVSKGPWFLKNSLCPTISSENLQPDTHTYFFQAITALTDHGKKAFQLIKDEEQVIVPHS